VIRFDLCRFELCRFALCRIVLCAVLALAACMSTAQAQVPPGANRFLVAVPAPAEQFDAGVLRVERHGDKGTSLILIPGLASGPWVWQDVVRSLKGQHTLYVLTLPGFDGRPAIEGDPWTATLEGLRQLIASRKLSQPVLVGHSLGGSLALALAADAPRLVGGVVSIDGLPVFPGTEDLQPGERMRMGEAMAEQMRHVDSAMFARQQQDYLRSVGLVDMGKADDLARLTAKSDPLAVGAWMKALVQRDLRPSLGAISVPVQLVVPFFEADAQGEAMPGSANMKRDYYARLLAGTPKLEAAIVQPARHFAMIDQPQQVLDILRKALAR
jgi:pimeloyl-ACP methyl ester carboxylesterase